MNNKLSHITKLTLITSCDCNLSCEYCVMKTINSSMAHIKNELQLNTIQSLKDNSFLENTKKTLDILKIDPKQIIQMEFWGQEPTLTLPFLEQHFKDWLNYLPSLNYLMFSSNFGNSPDIILNFITNLNTILNKPLSLDIQISYDGDWSCLNKRHIKPETIINNFKYLINELNKINLNYLNIRFWISGVLSLDLIKYLLNNEEEHKKYIIRYNNVQLDFKNSIINQKMEILPYCVTLEHPYTTATVEDGQLFTNFLMKTFQYSRTIDPSYLYLQSIIRRLKNEDDNTMFDELYSSVMFSSNPANEPPFFKTMSCGVYAGEIKLLYNGTLIDCFNNMYYTSKENIEILAQNKIEKSIRNNLLEHILVFDPNDPQHLKALDSILDLFNIFQDSFLNTLSGIMNLMLFLADVNQIENIYKYDNTLLLNHAQIISNLWQCEQENVLTSGSHYLKEIGYIKLLCNGALTYMDYLQKQIGERKDDEI